METMPAYLNTVLEATKKISNKREKTILKVHRELATGKNGPGVITERNLPVVHVGMTPSVATKTIDGSLPGTDTILVQILMKIQVDHLLPIDKGGGSLRNREGIKDNLPIIMVLES